MDSPILQDLVPIDRVWQRMAAVEGRLVEATTSDDRFLTKIAHTVSPPVANDIDRCSPR